MHSAGLWCMVRSNSAVDAVVIILLSNLPERHADLARDRVRAQARVHSPRLEARKRAGVPHAKRIGDRRVGSVWSLRACGPHVPCDVWWTRSQRTASCSPHTQHAIHGRQQRAHSVQRPHVQCTTTHDVRVDTHRCTRPATSSSQTLTWPCESNTRTALRAIRSKRTASRWMRSGTRRTSSPQPSGLLGIRKSNHCRSQCRLRRKRNLGASRA